jgi:hypothetical protein
MLFDLATSLPTAATTLPVREAAVMNAQLREIAPNFFGPPPPDPESEPASGMD